MFVSVSTGINSYEKGWELVPPQKKACSLRLIHTECDNYKDNYVRVHINVRPLLTDVYWTQLTPLPNL